MSKAESNPNRRHITSDAKLGLERLMVGRECNAFDRLPAERKALAFAELIGLGLIKGTVKEVAGRAYPDVIVQHVDSTGRKAFRKNRRSDSSGSSGSSGASISASKIALFAILFTVLVLVVLSLNYCKRA